jgi:hypothetical protein
MDAHVTVVGNADRAYVNMVELLLYSLRTKGGALRDVPVTIATNATGLPDDDRQRIRSFGATSVRTMPRQHGSLYADKFNALYAVEDGYDVLIYLDADVVILDDLEGLVQGIDPDEAVFRARTVGSSGARSAGPYESLVREFAASDDRPLETLVDERFPTAYPLFNGGVMVMTRPAATQIRKTAPEISYTLYARRSRESVHTLPQMVTELWHRLQDRFFPEVGPKTTYEYWMTEQMGVALSVLKHEIEYDLLEPRFNWVHDETPEDGALPPVYHYMKGRHEIDREHLLTGSWIDAYADSESPTRRALARVARECAADEQVAHAASDS